MEELIKYIAEAIVDHPEKVTVNKITGRRIIVLELKVAKEDIGKVIGKKGRIAHAIRTILAAVSGKTRERAILEIIE